MFLLTNTRHNVSHLKNVIVNSQQVNTQLKNENDKLKEQNNALLELTSKLNNITVNNHRIYPLKIKGFNAIENHQLKLFGSTRIAKNLLPVVDLRLKFPPIVDQGNLGSCTSCAVAGLVGYDKPGFIGSILFQYYNECVLENHVGQDDGATIADSVATLVKYGICPNSDWPYIISKFAIKPPQKAYTDALAHKALQYTKIANTMTSMKNALNSGYPFLLGINVYESFETAKVAISGMVPMPNMRREQLLGGHAIVCVGYDDNKQCWLMRNSWGTSWGIKGYFYLPYAYLTNSDLASDLWCIQKVN